jgi:tRNA A-37 threonylcarbamoyl transferase component Bud32
MRLWAPDDTLARAVLGRSLDPDWLLGTPACELLKLQRRVMVGRVAVAGRVLYVKRYNPYAGRAVLAASLRGSPARRAARAAARLARLGFDVPRVVAAVEWHAGRLVGRSFFLTEEVAGSVTLDRRWAALAGRGGRRTRAELLAALAALFGGLHAAGVYHADLKDVNVLVRDDGTLVLLDLERVAFGRSVSRARRIKNLVQLDRTLGRAASRGERLAFLRGYLGAGASPELLRRWAAEVLVAVAAKERGRRPAPRYAGGVSAMLVCQDESQHLPQCLATLAWCDEIVVVDGGSADDSVAVAYDHGARVIEHAWPGYREQKQFGLDACRMPWVLNVDADERVPHELADRLRRELASAPDDVAGFAIPRLVPYLGRWWFRGGWFPRRIVRLVRRTATTWGGVNPHERAVVSGRVVEVDEPLVHYSYVDTQDHIRSVRKLTRVAAARYPPDARMGGARLVGEPVWRFLRSFVLRRGMLDGLPGLFVAATDALYVLVRAARVWERTAAPEVSGTEGQVGTPG